MFELQVPDLLTEYDQDHPTFFTNQPTDWPDKLGQYFLALVGWTWNTRTGETVPFYAYTNGEVYLSTEAVNEIFNLSAAIHASGERDDDFPNGLSP
jgi:hypothetical protein